MRSRRFLVTGASGGLGSKVAAALAATGATVYAADLEIRTAEGDSGAGGRIIPLVMDVTDRASVSRARGLLDPEGLDGIVCAAGVFSGGPLVEIGEEEVRRTFEVNVMGAFRVVRELVPLLRVRRGRIVLISSESSWPVMPFTGPYAMSKCALEAYAHSLRREASLLGVGVILIRPGAIRTPLLESAEASFSRADDSSPFTAVLARARRMIGKERQGAMDPARVARLAVHALSCRRPRPTYRIGNDRLRSLLGRLPDSVADRLISRFLVTGPKPAAPDRSPSP